MNVEQCWWESLRHPCNAGSWCRWWPGDRHRSRNSSWRLGWQSCTILLRLASSRVDWLLHICLHVFTWLALPRRRILMWRRHSALAGHGLPTATLWSWWWTGVGRWRCARWHLWHLLLLVTHLPSCLHLDECCLKLCELASCLFCPFSWQCLSHLDLWLCAGYNIVAYIPSRLVHRRRMSCTNPFVKRFVSSSCVPRSFCLFIVSSIGRYLSCTRP